MALGPAGEIMRLAEAEGERLKPQVVAALRETLARLRPARRRLGPVEHLVHHRAQPRLGNWPLLRRERAVRVADVQTDDLGRPCERSGDVDAPGDLAVALPVGLLVGDPGVVHAPAGRCPACRSRAR